jgi:hypothetical protein
MMIDVWHVFHFHATIPMSSTLATPAEREQALAESVSQLESYAGLPLDWDGQGGQPAAECAVQFARGLVVALRDDREIPVPFVAPIDGGVYLEWRSDAAILYFEADKDSVLFAVREGSQVMRASEDADFNVTRAAELVRGFHNHAE